MNNENGLQAISLDEMQAIEGGHQDTSCQGDVARGARDGAIAGALRGLILPPGPLVGALIGGVTGAAVAFVMEPSCSSTCNQ